MTLSYQHGYLEQTAVPVWGDDSNQRVLRYYPAYLVPHLCLPHAKGHLLHPPSLAHRKSDLPDIGYDAQVPSPTRYQESGNPENPIYRSYTNNLLVENPGHTDSMHKRNKHCIEAIEPLLTFKTSTGEYIEISFGSA